MVTLAVGVGEGLHQPPGLGNLSAARQGDLGGAERLVEVDVLLDFRPAVVGLDAFDRRQGLGITAAEQVGLRRFQVRRLAFVEDGLDLVDGDFLGRPC